MSFEQVKATKAAVVAEVTEATPVSPTSGSDGFIALQESGFPMDPGPNFISSLEVAGTLDAGPGVPAGESPTATLDHYFRMSGVEGTAPNYSNIIESLMGEAVAINSTERTTTAGSTAGTGSAAAVLELAAGGSDFSRGKAVLIKESTYAVRNVTSVSSDTLTLAFNLSGATSSGIDTGKNIHYAMNNDGAPMTLWKYAGDGGAIEMIAGGKANAATITFPANDAINAAYTWSGTRYYFNPIEITSANKFLDITDDSGTFVVTLTEAMYRDPAALADHIQTVGQTAATASGGDDFFCSYSSSTGKYTLSTTTGSLLSILWKTGTHGADLADDHVGTTIGFDDAADDTGSLSYEADLAMDWSSPFTPVLDSVDFLTAKNNELLVGTFNEFACLSASSVTVNFSKTPEDVLDICEETAKASTIFADRTVTFDVVAYLERNDITKWEHFKENDTVQFAYTAGRKSSAGNWVAGSIVNCFAPTAKISAITIVPVGSVFSLTFTLTSFSDGGADSFYINML